MLTGTLVFTTPATIASPTGIYAITPAGQTSTNYAISYINGALTVGSPLPGGLVPSTVVVNGQSFSQLALLQQVGLLSYTKILADCVGKAGVVGGEAAKSVVLTTLGQCGSSSSAEFAAASR